MKIQTLDLINSPSISFEICINEAQNKLNDRKSLLLKLCYTEPDVFFKTK